MSRPRPRDVLPRVAKGAPEAFEECLDRHGPAVRLLARHYSETEQDAEDAVQEIFLDIWKSAGRFDSAVAAERTFVLMIARRRLMDRNRHRARRPGSAPLPDESPLLTSPSDEAERTAQLRSAGELIGQLSTEQARVLELSLVHGYTHSEISERLELPLGTVKTLIRRGLAKVRRIVSESPAKAEASKTR